MFDPRLGLEPMHRDHVAAACVHLMMQLCADEAPGVCDRVPVLLRAMLGLLRPQASSIASLRGSVQDILHAVVCAGPRGEPPLPRLLCFLTTCLWYSRLLVLPCTS